MNTTIDVVCSMQIFVVAIEFFFDRASSNFIGTGPDKTASNSARFLLFFLANANTAFIYNPGIESQVFS